MSEHAPRQPAFGRYGDMRVVATDQFTGRKYRCPYGWSGWSVWGRAKAHAANCAQATTCRCGHAQEWHDEFGCVAFDCGCRPVRIS